MTKPSSPASQSIDKQVSTDFREIKRDSIRSGKITFISQGISVILHFLSTIIMARLLGPSEYGVIAMVTAITSFAGLFRDLGLSSSTIQRDKLSHDQLSTLFWINVSMGALLTVILAACSPLVALFYGRTELTLVTICLSFSFVINSFSTQQSALLTRQMRFGRKAMATLSGSAATLLISAVAALNHLSYWSLVIGSLAGALVTTSLLNFVSGWRPGPPVRGSGVKSMLQYGANITGFEMINYFHRNLDNILIGRYCGTDALGIYNRAYQLLMFPISNLRGPIQAVAFPAMSKLQGQPIAFRDYYIFVTTILAFTSMPLTSFLFVSAKPLITLLLGEKWLSVIPIYCVLAITGFIQPSLGPTSIVLLGTGRARKYLHIGIFTTSVNCLGYIIGVNWGPIGVAVAYAVTNYILLYPFLRWTFHDSPVSVGDYFRAIALPATASVCSILACMVLSNWITGFNLLAQLACLGLFFASSYLGVYSVSKAGRSWLEKVFKHLKSLVPSLRR